MNDEQTKFIELRDKWLEEVSKQYHEVALYIIPHYTYYGSYSSNKAELMGKTLYRCFYEG